ncbi:uncharacterized protein LOC114945860 [Nylanderia fulva]|uniref:uncharacterized protein LOC114945860 n=1 Tax=Nylanderia fulva TaxID=613905 RepID=UPI0010FB5DFF|nr:uncharacterized protein LOC114945860 [Nylanderia fulva]
MTNNCDLNKLLWEVIIGAIHDKRPNVSVADLSLYAGQWLKNVPYRKQDDGSYGRHIVTSPPEVDRYAAIKERLTTVLGKTSASRLRKLLTTHELGDDKSSILLQKMRNLAEGQVTDGVLRTIFLEQLPENVRAILSISEVGDLSRLANQANKILDMAKPAMLAVQPVTAETGVLSKMATEIATLTKQMAALNKRIGSRSRSRSRRRSGYRDQLRSKSRGKEDNKFCFYHCGFGARAYKCKSPCAWKDEKKSEN